MNIILKNFNFLSYKWKNVINNKGMIMNKRKLKISLLAASIIMSGISYL